MHPCHENWVAIGRVVLFYAWAVLTFCAGIKCRHCREIILLVSKGTDEFPLPLSVNTGQVSAMTSTLPSSLRPRQGSLGLLCLKYTTQ